MSTAAQKISQRPLSNQLALLVVVTAIPLILASLFMYDRLVANERANIRNNLLVSAKTLALLVENEIDTHRAMGAALAHSANLQKEDLRAFWAEAKQALAFLPQSWLSVNSPDGRQLINTLLPPGEPLPRHVAPEVIARALSERQIQVSDLVFGPVGQRWVAFIEVPVFKDGQPLYSLSLTLSPERFRALMTSQFTHGEVVGIVDRAKRFVARQPDAAVGDLSSEGWRAAMAASPEGWVENKTLEGTLAITGYAPTADGWTAGIAVTEESIRAPAEGILRLTALVVIFLIVLSLVFAAVLARRTSRTMAAMAGMAEDLGEGRPLRSAPPTFSEAAVISTALVEAAAELKKRSEIIAVHQADLEGLVEERTRQLVEETERRQQSESALRQSQKMEAVGQLTGGVAHDFNNLLTIIIGSIEAILRARPDDQPRVRRLSETALQGAQRAAALTARLLAFSRRQPLAPVPVDLNALVRDMTDLLHRTLGEQIELEGVLTPRLWRVEVDPNQLENAILNLAVNARDAMPAGSKLTIETSNTSLDEGYVEHQPDVSVGQYVQLAVSDNGSGMSRETASRAFEPFFTTKEVGKGTGLGLSQVYGFVKQSGGHIAVYSEPGYGTTIKMYFPRYLGADTATESPATPVPAGGTSDRTVLVVEDNADVRAYSAGVLRELGYDVLEAADAEQALSLLGTARRVDLLFTDVVLPGKDGRALARAAVERHPDLKVLFTTGYSRNAIVHQGRLDPGVNLIVKPFTFEQLASRIREVLNSP
jgi:signal transduction histidine kinase